ncbi:MAG: intracellular protease, PfpI family [Acidimicrobiales bacterium]|nr:intracellular protease, PfpI family [Acidimicrobiales bacterium]
MADELRGRMVAFLATDGVEQVELTDPWQAVEAAGGTPRLVSTKDDEVQGFNHLDKADTFDVDLPVAQADAADFDALVLPGGVANPDALRMDEQAVAFVRAFAEGGKPIAVICHGPWTMVEADIVRDRKMTSWPSVRTDLRNAGATVVDEAVVVDTTGPSTFISSRNPDDLGEFSPAVVREFAKVPAHQG